MAFAGVKLAQPAFDAPGAGIFGRDPDKDHYIGSDQVVEIFIVTTSAGTNLGTLQTGFDMVKGGFANANADGSASNVIDVKPNAADATQADISAIPADGVYTVFIFGVKNPNQL